MFVISWAKRERGRVAELKYPRVLLKLSGEALAGEKGFGYDFDTVNRLADEVVSVTETGAALGLVIGGGNIWRGSKAIRFAIVCTCPASMAFSCEASPRILVAQSKIAPAVFEA